jgi:hypothetical protein
MDKLGRIIKEMKNVSELKLKVRKKKRKEKNKID